MDQGDQLSYCDITIWDVLVIESVEELTNGTEYGKL